MCPCQACEVEDFLLLVYPTGSDLRHTRRKAQLSIQSFPDPLNCWVLLEAFLPLLVLAMTRVEDGKISFYSCNENKIRLLLHQKPSTPCS